MKRKTDIVMNNNKYPVYHFYELPKSKEELDKILIIIEEEIKAVSKHRINLKLKLGRRKNEIYTRLVSFEDLCDEYKYYCQIYEAKKEEYKFFELLGKLFEW